MNRNPNSNLNLFSTLYAYWTKHTITTQSLITLTITFTTLYASVPAFKALVDTTYSSLPPRAHEFADAAVAIVGYLLVANRKPGSSNAPSSPAIPTPGSEADILQQLQEQGVVKMNPQSNQRITPKIK